MIYNDIKILLCYNFFDEINNESEKIKLFNIVKNLYRNRVFVYSSNDINLVKKSKKVVIMEDGRITKQGKYGEMIKDRSSKFYNMITMGRLEDFEANFDVKKFRSDHRTMTNLKNFSGVFDFGEESEHPKK